MIRPSRTALALGLAALLASVLIAVISPATQGMAFVLWALLGLVGVADIVMTGRRRSELVFDVPPEVFVGETVNIILMIKPWREGMRAELDWPQGLSGDGEVTFDRYDSHAEVIIPCRAVRRGTWTIERIWLYWPSRFGLFEYVPRIATEITVKVVPNIRLVQSGQITTTVNSALYGVKENRAIGDGSEFHQLQDFVRGMDVKAIDWKRSARKRSLVVKELRAERNHHVIVALDNGYLMREEIAGLPKIDHAITAALATAWAAAIGGDLVGFYAYDVQPSIFVRPEPGRTAFARLRSQTAELDYVSRETNHTLAMAGLNARTPKRSLIIIFTDFVDTTSAELLIENIRVLTKRHLVIFVTLRDPALEEMVHTAPESLDNVATLVAAGASLRERRLVLEKLHRLGATIVDAEPGQVTSRLISTYLEIKARELI
ncbi:MAG: DUF58 domain-containing protein [Pseudomonadota bacterium]